MDPLLLALLFLRWGAKKPSPKKAPARMPLERLKFAKTTDETGPQILDVLSANGAVETMDFQANGTLLVTWRAKSRASSARALQTPIVARHFVALR